MRKTILAFALQIALFAGLSAQNYFSVKFPDDVTVYGCGVSPGVIPSPQIYNQNSCAFNVGVSYQDFTFNMNNTGGCKKIIRIWKLVYWCDYNPNWLSPTVIDNPGDTDTGPTVWGNSLNHGFLQYTQIIKIVDQVPPVFLHCPTSVVACDNSGNDPNQYGSACEGGFNLTAKITDLCSKSDLIVSYRLYLDLDANGTMETYRSSSAPGAWPIEKTINADTVTVKIKPPTGTQLPYATHKVEWIANDRCGNETVCKYDFIVKDCAPPSLVCHPGFNVNIMATGMISVSDNQFLQYIYENCTPLSGVKIGIRKVGSGTGFPGEVHTLTFDCNEIGKQYVEIWAQDAGGNANYCTAYVKIQDNGGFCVPPGPVSGSIADDQQRPVPGARILLQSNLPAIAQQASTLSDSLGQYSFAAAPGTCNYALTPTLDTLPQLGVTTLDALLTELHMTGQDTLTSPYRVIAADANRDGALTAADLEAMTQVAIGTASAFPANKSWRFVPTAFVFPDSVSPLSMGFPEKINTICPPAPGLGKHFVAIKTGDVDGSAQMPNLVGSNADTRADEGVSAIFWAENQVFRAGETVVVRLQSPELAGWAGFQFTLEADPALLALEGAESALAKQVGTFVAQNRATVSWYSASRLEGQFDVLSLTFKALRDGSVAEALRLGSSVAVAEAYGLDLLPRAVGLHFGQRRASEVGGVRLFPVSPNPTAGPVEASFFLPGGGWAVLTLVDAQGRVVAEQAGDFAGGYGRVSLGLPVGQTGGVLFLQLRCDAGTAVQRVVVR
jgi:hypothetical protein